MNKNVLIAAGVFAVLLVIVLATRGKDDKVGVKELKVATVAKEDVTRVDIVIPGKKATGDAGPAAAAEPAKKVSIEKSGESWKVFDTDASGKKFDAEESQIKSLLDAVGEFATGDLIATKKEKLADFEIDDDKGLQTKISTSKGAGLELLFGRPAKGGGSTVRTAGSNDVFVAKGRLGSLLKKDVTGWRKKALVDVKVEDIATISVKRADGQAYMVEGVTEAPPAADIPDAGPPPPPKTEWKLKEPATLPKGFRLDAIALSRLSSSFTALRAVDFADGATDQVAGFDGPHTVVETTKKDGKKIVVHFGKEDDKKRIYAKVEGDAQVYLLAGYAAKGLDKPFDDFRDLTLFSGAADDVEKVSFTTGTNRFVVKKDKDAWKLVEPKTAPPEFDEGQIQPQIASLLRTRAARIELQPKADTGLNKPSTVVEVTFKGGKTQSLRFGAGIPAELDDGKAGDKPKNHYVKGGADDFVYAIGVFNKNRFEKPAELFKKPPPMPQGGGGGLSGLESLPPDVRKKLEESMKRGDFAK